MVLDATHIFPAAVDPDFTAFPSRRSVVHSTKGIVSSTQPLASQAGVQILQKGGNAADAAVAVAACLNVTEPSMTGIGGDMFCLFYNSETKKVHALNGSGRAAKNATLEGVKKELGLTGKGGQIPMTSVHAVTVPGAAAGWVDSVAKFGSGKVTMSEILAPAIKLAEEGFPVSELSGYYWGASEQTIRNASPNFSEMLKKDSKAKDGCRAPGPGELMRNPTLASTFRKVAEHGKKGFYEGFVAEALVKVTSDLGGHLTLEDLKNHAELGSEEVEAITLRFQGQGVNKDHGGIDVWEHPPNGQGIVALMALGILEQLEKDGKIKTWTEKDHNSVDHLHACIEALKISFADASWWVADPNISKVPTQELISKPYLAERAKLFNPTSTAKIIDHGSPAHNHSDTVYFAVTDSHGNGSSFINSNFGGFGTAIIPKDCGFTLQNRGANFILDPDHPNRLEGGKRPYHTIIPAMLTNPNDGSLHSVYGVMGGFMQPQGHVQVLLNMLTFKLTPQAALDAPRFCIGAGYNLEHKVFLEEGIKPEVVEGLRRLGHDIEVVSGVEKGICGRGQIIRAHYDDGQLIYSAGSDPRGDGAAMPA